MGYLMGWRQRFYRFGTCGDFYNLLYLTYFVITSSKAQSPFWSESNVLINRSIVVFKFFRVWKDSSRCQFGRQIVSILPGIGFNLGSRQTDRWRGTNIFVFRGQWLNSFEWKMDPRCERKFPKGPSNRYYWLRGLEKRIKSASIVRIDFFNHLSSNKTKKFTSTEDLERSHPASSIPNLQPATKKTNQPFFGNYSKIIQNNHSFWTLARSLRELWKP